VTGASLACAAIIGISSSLGYLLPAIIGLESMGVPSPGETALVLAAVLAGEGKLDIWIVIPIGIASAIVGDNLGYLLGRHLGRDVLIAAGPFREHRRRLVALGERFFDRHGAKTIFIGRWIAWIRFAVAWLSGINHVPFPVFFLWNAAGAITWGTTYGLIGYFGGKALADVIESAGLLVGVAIIVIVVIAMILSRTRRRRAQRSGSEAHSPPPSQRAQLPPSN
jgi:membrane-associated protein